METNFAVIAAFIWALLTRRAGMVTGFSATVTLISFNPKAKIPAIKALRDVTGLGLKGTKTLAELIQEGTPVKISLGWQGQLESLLVAGWNLRCHKPGDLGLTTGPILVSEDGRFVSVEDSVKARRVQCDPACDSGHGECCQG